MDTILLRKNRFIWALLAFQGGFLNVGGLLSLHVFVSHITGFSGHFSVEFSQGYFLKSFYFVLVPLFFLLGAFFSSLFTEIKKYKQKNPIYITILLLLSFIFFIISLFGEWGLWGPFGLPFHNFNDFILLSLLAFSCGAQNALFTKYSQSIIRTTHLTGITTDLGIGLAKFWFSKDENEKKMNKIRIDLIVSFIMGSLAAAFIFPHLKFRGFIFPSLMSLFIGLRLYKTRRENERNSPL